jgi:hypothetical protein
VNGFGWTGQVEEATAGLRLGWTDSDLGNGLGLVQFRTPVEERAIYWLDKFKLGTNVLVFCSSIGANSHTYIRREMGGNMKSISPLFCYWLFSVNHRYPSSFFGISLLLSVAFRDKSKLSSYH